MASVRPALGQGPGACSQACTCRPRASTLPMHTHQDCGQRGCVRQRLHCAGGQRDSQLGTPPGRFTIALLPGLLEHSSDTHMEVEMLGAGAGQSARGQHRGERGRARRCAGGAALERPARARGRARVHLAGRHGCCGAAAGAGRPTTRRLLRACRAPDQGQPCLSSAPGRPTVQQPGRSRCSCSCQQPGRSHIRACV